MIEECVVALSEDPMAPTIRQLRASFRATVGTVASPATGAEYTIDTNVLLDAAKATSLADPFGARVAWTFSVTGTPEELRTLP